MSAAATAAERATRELLEAIPDPGAVADAAVARSQAAAAPRPPTKQRGRTGSVNWDSSKHKRGPGGRFAAGGGGQTGEAQRRLHKQGLYQGQIDAEHGPQTTAAVKAFQDRYGLKPTGKIDQATMDTIKAPPPKSREDLSNEAAKAKADAAAKKKSGKTARTGRHSGGTAKAPGSADWQGDLSSTGVLRQGDGAHTKRGGDANRGSAEVQLMQAKLEALGFDLGDAGPDGKFGPATAAAVKAFQRAYGLTADGIVGRHTKLMLNLLGKAEGTPDPNALSIDQMPLSRRPHGSKTSKNPREQVAALTAQQAARDAVTTALARTGS